MTAKEKNLNCADCATINCTAKTSTFPAFCLTEAEERREIEEVQPHLPRGAAGVENILLRGRNRGGLLRQADPR